MEYGTYEKKISAIAAKADLEFQVYLNSAQWASLDEATESMTQRLKNLGEQLISFTESVSKGIEDAAKRERFLQLQVRTLDTSQRRFSGLVEAIRKNQG